jgi:PmbA protein
MSNSTVHDMAVQLLDAARKAGADEADVLAVEADGLSVKTRNGKTDEVERSETQDFGLRVFVNKASAVVSGAIRSSADAATMAERAVAMAKIAPPDVSLGLLDPSSGAIDGAGLELDDGVMKQADELAALAAEAEAAAASVTGVSKTDNASAHSGRRRIVLLNSRGFEGSYSRSGHSHIRHRHCRRRHRDGTRVRLLGQGALCRSQTGWRHRQARRRAGRARAGPAQDQIAKVPDTVRGTGGQSTFPSLLASAANGAAVARGTSFLKDAMGTAGVRARHPHCR